MNSKSLLFNWRYQPRKIFFIVFVSLLTIGTVKGSLAQNSQPRDGVFIPLVVNEQGAGNEQAVGSVDNHDHLHIGHLPENGRFTTNDGLAMSWPPQIKYIKDVVWDTNATQIEASQLTEFGTIATVASSNAEFRELLGERFTFISAIPIQEKWQEALQGHQVTYFSYSNNITIEAFIDGEEVDDIATYAAAEYQPPLRQNEVDEAIVIARQYWQEQGNTRVNDLQGFTIQTFRTDGDGGYYDTRMSYVSFHLDELSEPELLTWVDLTTQTVLRAAIDQGGVQYEQ